MLRVILIIWICINTVLFPIYCVILIILQKEYLDLMTEVEHFQQERDSIDDGEGHRLANRHLIATAALANRHLIAPAALGNRHLITHLRT